MTNKKWLLGLVIVLVVLVLAGSAYAIYYFVQKNKVVCVMEAIACPDGTTPKQIGPCKYEPCPTAEINATYYCSDKKFIKAKFTIPDDKFVDLELSDGRTLHVPRAISASGARYATPDESFVFWNKGDMAFIEEPVGITYKDCVTKTESADTNTGLANPASTNCKKVGGNLVMKNKPDGSQYGLCYFEDNRACEEWALIMEDCPVGGVKTTGFVTEAQSFCAWSGGSTFAVENAVCKFKDGSSCPVDSFYNGTCRIGENK